MTTTSPDRLATVAYLAMTAIDREAENAHLALLFAAVQVARLRRISEDQLNADFGHAVRLIRNVQ